MMLDKLDQAISRLPSLLSDKSIWDSIVVNLRKPHTYRVFTYLEDGTRLSLHKFDQCDRSEAFFHTHPWPGAFRVLRGAYEMAVGYSQSITDLSPKLISTFRLTPGSSYEMSDPCMWHSITPIYTTYTVMINDPPWPKNVAHIAAPTTVGKPLGKMTDEELDTHLEMFKMFLNYENRLPL